MTSQGNKVKMTRILKTAMNIFARPRPAFGKILLHQMKMISGGQEVIAARTNTQDRYWDHKTNCKGARLFEGARQILWTIGAANEPTWFTKTGSSTSDNMLIRGRKHWKTITIGLETPNDRDFKPIVTTGEMGGRKGSQIRSVPESEIKTAYQQECTTMLHKKEAPEVIMEAKTANCLRVEIHEHENRKAQFEAIG